MSLFRDTEIRAARGTTLTAKSWLTEAPRATGSVLMRSSKC